MRLRGHPIRTLPSPDLAYRLQKPRHLDQPAPRHGHHPPSQPRNLRLERCGGHRHRIPARGFCFGHRPESHGSSATLFVYRLIGISAWQRGPRPGLWFGQLHPLARNSQRARKQRGFQHQFLGNPVRDGRCADTHLFDPRTWHDLGTNPAEPGCGHAQHLHRPNRASGNHPGHSLGGIRRPDFGLSQNQTQIRREGLDSPLQGRHPQQAFLPWQRIGVRTAELQDEHRHRLFGCQNRPAKPPGELQTSHGIHPYPETLGKQRGRCPLEQQPRLWRQLRHGRERPRLGLYRRPLPPQQPEPRPQPKPLVPAVQRNGLLEKPCHDLRLELRGFQDRNQTPCPAQPPPADSQQHGRRGT